MLLSHLDQEVQARHSLTSGLNLELKVTFVLMQRSVSQAASSATYPPAALDDDDVCACGDKQKVNKQQNKKINKNSSKGEQKVHNTQTIERDL